MLQTCSTQGTAHPFRHLDTVCAQASVCHSIHVHGLHSIPALFQYQTVQSIPTFIQYMTVQSIPAFIQYQTVQVSLHSFRTRLCKVFLHSFHTRLCEVSLHSFSTRQCKIALHSYSTRGGATCMPISVPLTAFQSSTLSFEPSTSLTTLLN